ncbi:MAG: hypothetical protein AAF403_08850, partial [Pseudomonadota bacterium]
KKTAKKLDIDLVWELINPDEALSMPHPTNVFNGLPYMQEYNELEFNMISAPFDDFIKQQADRPAICAMPYQDWRNRYLCTQFAIAYPHLDFYIVSNFQSKANQPSHIEKALKHLSSPALIVIVDHLKIIPIITKHAKHWNRENVKILVVGFGKEIEEIIQNHDVDATLQTWPKHNAAFSVHYFAHQIKKNIKPLPLIKPVLSLNHKAK